MQRIVKRFNAENNQKLMLTVGISAGPVVAGIVGRDKFIYDVWGDTVEQADIAVENGEPGEIVVTTPVHDKLQDLFGFREMGREGLAFPLWVLLVNQPSGNA